MEKTQALLRIITRWSVNPGLSKGNIQFEILPLSGFFLKDVFEKFCLFLLVFFGEFGYFGFTDFGRVNSNVCSGFLYARTPNKITNNKSSDN